MRNDPKYNRIKKTAAVDLVILYTDDCDALYVNGQLAVENPDEKTSLPFELAIRYIKGRHIRTIKFVDLGNFAREDDDPYFPNRLSDLRPRGDEE